MIIYICKYKLKYVYIDNIIIIQLINLKPLEIRANYEISTDTIYIYIYTRIIIP